MRCLLDTHALVWALADPGRLPERVRAHLEDASNEVFASAACVWEIAIKRGLDRIDVDLEELVRGARTIGFDELPIRGRHAARLLELPDLPRDPFDRILVAQAIEEGLTLISRDPVVQRYPVPTLWD